MKLLLASTALTGAMLFAASVESGTFTPSPELHPLAVEGTDRNRHQTDASGQIAKSVSPTFNSPEEHQDYLASLKTQVSNQRPSTLNSSCENEPSYLATHRTFGMRFEQGVSLAVNDMHRPSLNAGAAQSEFFEEFTVEKFPVLNLHDGAGSVGGSDDKGHWDYQKEAQRIVHHVQKAIDDNIIAIDIKGEESRFNIISSVNYQFSFIDGIQVADLTPENATTDSPHMLNECVTEAFSEMFASVVTDMDGTVISSFGWNPDRLAGEGGVPNPGTGSSWTTQSPDLCRAHFYRNHDRSFGFVIPCP